MTLDQYLIIREGPEVPMPAWFEFYREKGGVIEDYDIFVKVFTTLIRNESIVKGSDGNSKQITLKTALDRFYGFYNAKFGL